MWLFKTDASEKSKNKEYEKAEYEELTQRQEDDNSFQKIFFGLRW